MNRNAGAGAETALALSGGTLFGKDELRGAPEGPERARWMWGLLAAYVFLVFLTLAVLNPSVDRNSLELIKLFFSASCVVLALWMGYGRAQPGARAMKPSIPPRE